MTIYHTHHIVPKHAGGTDDPSNLVQLTVEEHAEAHLNLYKKYNRWQDKVAWQSLSGQITSDEARRIAVSNALKGNSKSDDHRKKLQENLKKNGFNANPMFTKEHKEKLSKKAKERPIVKCPHCKKQGQKNAMHRWHFENCKYK